MVQNKRRHISARLSPGSQGAGGARAACTSACGGKKVRRRRTGLSWAGAVGRARNSDPVVAIVHGTTLTLSAIPAPRATQSDRASCLGPAPSPSSRSLSPPLPSTSRRLHPNTTSTRCSAHSSWATTRTAAEPFRDEFFFCTKHYADAPLVLPVSLRCGAPPSRTMALSNHGQGRPPAMYRQHTCRRLTRLGHQSISNLNTLASGGIPMVLFVRPQAPTHG